MHAASIVREEDAHERTHVGISSLTAVPPQTFITIIRLVMGESSILSTHWSPLMLIKTNEPLSKMSAASTKINFKMFSIVNIVVKIKEKLDKFMIITNG